MKSEEIPCLKNLSNALWQHIWYKINKYGSRCQDVNLGENVEDTLFLIQLKYAVIEIYNYLQIIYILLFT